jgi:hypothetical protein
MGTTLVLGKHTCAVEGAPGCPDPVLFAGEKFASWNLFPKIFTKLTFSTKDEDYD